MGGGRSQRLLKVVPRKEKNRDDDRKEPVGDVNPGPLPLKWKWKRFEQLSYFFFA